MDRPRHKLAGLGWLGQRRDWRLGIYSDEGMGLQ